jgi:hypothetical protein
MLRFKYIENVNLKSSVISGLENPLHLMTLCYKACRIVKSDVDGIRSNDLMKGRGKEGKHINEI